MSALPPEILLEILVSLPVKDLLRSRAVSKAWCALIDSPDFIKLHLKHSLKTHSNLSIIITNGVPYTTDFEQLDKREHRKRPFEKFHSPFEKGDLGSVIGSSNGLIALKSDKLGVALWNPTTRKYHKVPYSPIETSRDYWYDGALTYGLGYDSVTNDYKIVKISQFYEHNWESVLKSEFKVYSLKFNSWRRIFQELSYCIYEYCYDSGVFVSNALHWLGLREPETDTPNLIVAFDMALENCRLVPLPDANGVVWWYNIFELGGCLGLTCIYFQDHADIWVMKEYGVKESWIKLFSVDGSFENLLPFAYSKDGKKVLMWADCKFCSYDLTMNKVRYFNIRGCWRFSPTFCVESLVQLGDRC